MYYKDKQANEKPLRPIKVSLKNSSEKGQVFACCLNFHNETHHLAVSTLDFACSQPSMTP